MKIVNRDTVYKGFFALEVATTDQGNTVETLRTNDSACVLLYDRERDRVLLARQQRVAMMTPENPDGWIVELVAGRFDRALGPALLGVHEAKEEVDVIITEDEVEVVNFGVSMATSAGQTTEKSYLLYVEICPGVYHPEDKPRGVDAGESVNRVWVPVAELETMTFDCCRVFGMINWFLRKRAAQGRK